MATQSAAEGDGFVTELACTLQVTDAGGAVVPLMDRNRRLVPALTDTKRDFTRSPIRDYFLLFRFPIPDRPGEYTVTVKVLDPAGGRRGQPDADQGAGAVRVAARFARRVSEGYPLPSLTRRANTATDSRPGNSRTNP